MTAALKLAWRNMWRNWRRTAIALVAITLGTTLLLLVDGIIHGSDQAIFGNAVRLYGGNLQVHAPGYRARAQRMPLLPLDDPAAVMSAAGALPGVAAATPRISTAGIATSRGSTLPVAITAIDPAAEAPFSLQAQHIVAGRFLAADDGDGMLIGRGLADRLGVAVGDPIVLLGRSRNTSMRQHTMTVVGIYDLQMPDVEKGLVFIPLADAQTLYGLRDQATEVAIFLRAVGGEDALLPTLQARLPGYEVDTWQTLRPEIRQALDSKIAFSSIMGMIIILIAAIGLLNLLLMAVFERTREMGVLAALGMRGRQIMGLFLLEGTLIGAVGAALGCTLGLALNLLIAQVGISLSYGAGMGEAVALLGNRLYPQISSADLASRAATVILIAAAASIYPAWQAARSEPVTALRHV